MRKRTHLIGLVLAGLLLLSAGSTASYALQLGGRQASEWINLLERPERISNLEIAEVVSRLVIQPGAVVADIGAGSGVFSLPFAREVGTSRKSLRGGH